MEMKRLICLVLAITGSLSAPFEDANQLGQSSGSSKDHEDIVEITKFVRDQLAKDVQANRDFTEKSNEQSEDIANAILQHVKDLNRNTTTKFEETLKNLKTAIETNMKTIVDQTKENHEALEDRSKKNEAKISEKSTESFNDLLGKLTARLDQHEKMLNTHVAVCANQHSSIGKGKVTYQHTSMENVIIGGDKKRSHHVLEPSQGEFTVPEGADGTYQITFTAIIDTLKDTTDNRAPAKFVFATKQARGSFIKMEATTLSASAGHPGQDKVPASRSILLDLKAGEKVAVIQTRSGAESSYRITFCAHLIRPTAPATWQPLPEAKAAPVLAIETTYEEPKQDPLTVDDLTVKFEEPKVEMPGAEKALLFPETDFYKKTPTSGESSPDSIDPLGAGSGLGGAEDPNEL